MTKTTRRRTLKAGAWIWSAVLLAVFAVSFVTIRVLAARTAGGYPTPPFFHLFFSDTIHMKAWLATGAIVLALFQALTGARIFEIVHFAPYGRSWNRIHRISGSSGHSPAVHSLLGSAFYGAFLGKVIVVRSGAFPGWALPVAGALLFAIGQASDSRLPLTTPGSERTICARSRRPTAPRQAARRRAADGRAAGECHGALGETPGKAAFR